jgi:hypothetical protein
MYLQMIVGVYATLGVFFLIASRDPLVNRSLIWFTVWSSIVHGGIMAVQSIVFPEHRGHLLGDVPALVIVAGVLALLMPRRATANSGPPTSPNLLIANSELVPPFQAELGSLGIC